MGQISIFDSREDKTFYIHIYFISSLKTFKYLSIEIRLHALLMKNTRNPYPICGLNYQKLVKENWSPKKERNQSTSYEY